jgi:STE24 endopeptidase
MALLFIAIYSLYVFVKILIEIREIIFIKDALLKKAVLMQEEEYKVAGLYALYSHFLKILSDIVSLIIVVFWFEIGFKIINFGDGLLKEVIEVIVFFGINYLFTLPLKVYSKKIDEKFGFSTSDWKLFFKDEIKKAILFLIFGTLIFAGLIYFIDNFENWWLIGFLFSFFVVILVNILFPFFAKFFNKFEPLKDEKLRGDIESLLEKAGFKADKIFVVDASKRDTRLNAYFAGIGKSKRVVLYDTLIKKLDKDELLAVLGHELGHFKHKDIFKNIAVIGVMLFVLFFVLGHIPKSFFEDIGLSKNGAGIIMVGIFVSDILFFLLQPLINLVSRVNEFRADEFGSELVSKDALKRALVKLVSENKHFPRVSKLYSILYYTHPPILERIKRLEDESVNNRD